LNLVSRFGRTCRDRGGYADDRIAGMMHCPPATAGLWLFETARQEIAPRRSGLLLGMLGSRTSQERLLRRRENRGETAGLQWTIEADRKRDGAEARAAMDLQPAAFYSVFGQPPFDGEQSVAQIVGRTTFNRYNVHGLRPSMTACVAARSRSI
jgi:hypothetical protein